MKKLHLLGTVCALTIFAMNSSALAAIVVSDDTSIASTGQSYAQTLASSSFSASAPTLDFSYIASYCYLLLFLFFRVFRPVTTKT